MGSGKIMMKTLENQETAMIFVNDLSNEIVSLISLVQSPVKVGQVDIVYITSDTKYAEYMREQQLQKDMVQVSYEPAETAVMYAFHTLGPGQKWLNGQVPLGEIDDNGTELRIMILEIIKDLLVKQACALLDNPLQIHHKYSATVGSRVSQAFKAHGWGTPKPWPKTVPRNTYVQSEKFYARCRAKNPKWKPLFPNGWCCVEDNGSELRIKILEIIKNLEITRQVSNKLQLA